MTFVATPMLRFGQAPKLRGITVVAGWSLNVPAAAFAAGSVMDSRTAMTRLPPPTYQALRAAFRPCGPERERSLDTCYDFAGVLVVTAPRVALVFVQNTAAGLDPSGILLDDFLALLRAQQRRPHSVDHRQRAAADRRGALRRRRRFHGLPPWRVLIQLNYVLQVQAGGRRPIPCMAR
jgi:hypothetical protein